MIVYSSFLVRKGYSAFAFWPLIIIKDKSKFNSTLFNHERIHLRQQIELLVLPFYLIYFSEYLIRRMQYDSWREAYESISFEREAFAHEKEVDYLKSRKIWAWTSYL